MFQLAKSMIQLAKILHHTIQIARQMLGAPLSKLSSASQAKLQPEIVLVSYQHTHMDAYSLEGSN